MAAADVRAEADEEAAGVDGPHLLFPIGSEERAVARSFFYISSKILPFSPDENSRIREIEKRREIQEKV